jgi:CheY-like chemotaxis protein
VEFETVEILIAEDEELDRFLLEHSFKAQMLRNPLRFFENGQELLDFLDSRLGERMHDRYIIITDINMPLMGGYELLANL